MESLQPLLDNSLKDHPDMREEVASLIGYTTRKLLGGDEETGSTVAWNGTKFNWLNCIIYWNRKCVKTAKIPSPDVRRRSYAHVSVSVSQQKYLPMS